MTLPVFVPGDQCVCSLRLLEHGEGDMLREKNLNVRTLRASIGSVLEPPTGGMFTLRFTGDASAELKPGSRADEMKSAVSPSNTETKRNELPVCSALFSQSFQRAA